jgi:hypothetical protein
MSSDQVLDQVSDRGLPINAKVWIGREDGTIDCKDCGKSMIADGYRPRCGDCRKTNARNSCIGYAGIPCGGRVYKFEGIWNKICSKCFRKSQEAKAQAKEAKAEASL